MIRNAILLATIGGWVSAAMAENLTITPNIVTNNFAGKIVYEVSGLTNGQSILVEKYGDLNGNGLIDAGEPVVQAGLVTDGVVPMIGGIRNANVPGDEDGVADGQVRMELLFPGADKGLDAFATKYVIKISTPGTSGALATSAFEVRQMILAQGVSGRLTKSGTGVGLAYSTVALLPPNGDPVTGAVTDGNGNYTMYCQPGDYIVLPLAPGFVGNFNGGVMVSGGSFAGRDMALSAATRTISGKLEDSANGMGIPGVMISAQSESGQWVSGYSRSDGTFSIGVTANAWAMGLSSDSLTPLGYLGWSDERIVDATSGDVANVHLPADRATALIYGTVKDGRNEPVAGVPVSAEDQPQQRYDASGSSIAPDANYCIAVAPGDWWVAPESEFLEARGYTAQGTTVTISGGQALRVDLKLRQTNELVPIISSPALLPDGSLQFVLTDAAGQYYTVDYSTNLLDWTTLLTTNLSGSASLSLNFPIMNSVGFYRARNNSAFDGRYTGTWTKTCPACNNETTSGTFAATLVNGEFTDISVVVTNGSSGIRFSSGSTSLVGLVTGTGTAPSQCSESVSTFTGQITVNASGSAVMSIAYSRLSSPQGCEAEFGTVTATRP